MNISIKRPWLRFSRIPAALVVSLLLHGCASTTPASLTQTASDRDGAPAVQVDFSAIPDAVPRPEPPARWGNKPYSVFGKTYQVMSSGKGFVQRGLASWYGTKYHGRTTSSGEVYDMYAMTAAHNSLPLPTYAEITNLENGRSVVVKINDRGPFHGNRVLDLSYAAAGKLDMLGKGVAAITIRAIDTGAPVQRMAATPAAKPGNGYVLQVGAFANRQNADSLRSDLERSLGYAALIRPGNNGPRPVYKVQIGPLNYQEAENASFRLAQLGYTDTRLIMD